MTEVDLDSFELSDKEIQADPYPFYPALRRKHPVYQTEFMGRPCWVLSRRKDVSAALLDPKTFSARTTPLPIMLFADPPEHGPMRALVASRFTPQAISTMADEVRTVTDKLLDGCLAKGKVEAVGEFASPLTIHLMSRFLGISEDAVDRVSALSRLIIENVVAVRKRQRSNEAMAVANEEVFRFFLDLAHSRSYDEQGVLAILFDAHRNGTMSDEEMVHSATLLFVAGHSTTTNLIGNSLYILTQRADDLARIRQDPDYLEAFIEEVLRLRPSFHRAWRVTTREVELHGERIPARADVLLLLAAANRDPDSFDCPDAFDAEKKRRAHLSFGQGVHTCLGSWLARLEARIALTQIASRVAELTLDDEQRPLPLMGGTMNEFGFEALPVVMRPR